MQIICPECATSIASNAVESVCENGHRFKVINGVLDLMPTTSDNSILEEQAHWDQVAERKSMSINPDSYMAGKTVDQLRVLYKKIITQFFNDYATRFVSIGELGCGSGSGVTYLDMIDFAGVEYVGIDVSIKLLSTGARKKPPSRWTTNFIRASANLPIFAGNSCDIIFCAAALHHLDLENSISWTAECIKPGGLLVLNEPSLKNPFAALGRRMVKNFHTKGEKPIDPNRLKMVASMNNLDLKYEKGFHFLTGPLEYLVGMLKFPKPLIVASYYFGRAVDFFVIPVSLNYSFVQIFQKSDKS